MGLGYNGLCVKGLREEAPVSKVGLDVVASLKDQRNHELQHLPGDKVPISPNNNGGSMVILRIANALLDDLTRLAVGIIWRSAVLALFIAPVWGIYHAL